MSLIQMENISKYYSMGAEPIKALDDVSLAVEKGEFVAIMGPSGSGKSTLMNIMGCLDLPDSGVYALDGIRISELGDNRLSVIRNQKIGFVFQSFNLLPGLSAFENVELPLIYRGVPRKIRAGVVAQALESLELHDHMEHRPSQLSGGQQQRVAIARALAGDPPIILADEPTGALDTKTGTDLLFSLKKLNEQGKTIILITHDLSVAAQAERVIRLKDGKIEQE